LVASSSPPTLAFEGIKALSKRHQQRKNGLSRPTGTGLNKKPALPQTAVKRSAAGSSGSGCCRMLFGAVDHDEVLEWLAERHNERRQQLTAKYGFDITLAEEGVHPLPSLQTATSTPTASSC
jgi:hypothetical protein